MAAWFYKDGKGEIFESDECPIGWFENPKASLDVKPVKKATKVEIPTNNLRSVNKKAKK